MTAVEWLKSKLVDCWFKKELEAFEKAKEMEKQQIIDAYKAELYPCSDEDAEQYYNETFKK